MQSKLTSQAEHPTTLSVPFARGREGALAGSEGDAKNCDEEEQSRRVHLRHLGVPHAHALSIKSEISYCVQSVECFSGTTIFVEWLDTQN